MGENTNWRLPGGGDVLTLTQVMIILEDLLCDHSQSYIPKFIPVSSVYFIKNCTSACLLQLDDACY